MLDRLSSLNLKRFRVTKFRAENEAMGFVIFCAQLMKVIGNENANKVLEYSVQSDDLIDTDADECV